jgi:hypothetical protein
MTNVTPTEDKLKRAMAKVYTYLWSDEMKYFDETGDVDRNGIIGALRTIGRALGYGPDHIPVEEADA